MQTDWLSKTRSRQLKGGRGEMTQQVAGDQIFPPDFEDKVRRFRGEIEQMGRTGMSWYCTAAALLFWDPCGECPSEMIRFPSCLCFRPWCVFFCKLTKCDLLSCLFVHARKMLPLFWNGVTLSVSQIVFVENSCDSQKLGPIWYLWGVFDGVYRAEAFRRR